MAFLVIVAAVIVAFLLAVFHAYRGEPRGTWRGPLGISVLAGAWIGFCAAWVASGRMATLPFFFGAILLVSALSGLMPLGRRLAVATPLAALIGFQAFRLPLELVLHQWAKEGTIPTTMTWSGQNWDIIAGTVALVAAPFAARRRAVAWCANLVGFVLLLNVIRVAVMSSPLPFAWGQQPPLLLALHLPYALIGPVCVGGAFFGHVVLTRALLRAENRGERA